MKIDLAHAGEVSPMRVKKGLTKDKQRSYDERQSKVWKLHIKSVILTMKIKYEDLDKLNN